MISASHLQKTFVAKGASKGSDARHVLAVRDVSFTAEDGAITGLLGPNGAGKSTTLRMLATLIKPDQGSAEIDGFNVVSHVLDARRQLGFMPHNAGIYPRLTSRENIQYYARLCGLDKNSAMQRTGELIEQLAMTRFADRRTAGFSQGQRTKVALARALVHQPKTLLLDEPTNGLDVMATRGLRDIIRDLAARGHCVVFSSHIMQEVAALCDEIAIISDGTVVMEDSLENILLQTGEDDLEDAFVAAIGANDDSNDWGAHE